MCGARALTCARGGTQSGLFSTCLPDLLSSCDAFHGEAFDIVVLEFFINDDVLGSDAKLFEGLELGSDDWEEMEEYEYAFV